LFESLESLTKASDGNKDFRIYFDEYKATYNLFHESVTKLSLRYSDVLDGFYIPFDDRLSFLNFWEHKWHFIYKVVNSELSVINQTNHLGLEVVFQNIRETIISLLSQATSEIIVAMAWLTDKELMQLLIKKIHEGVFVEIIISDSDENFSERTYLGLIEKKCTFWVSRINSEEGMMHNKFCVIDKRHVITGSYNWTYKANLNLENILIVRNNLILAEEYCEKFKQIKILPETLKLEEFLSQ